MKIQNLKTDLSSKPLIKEKCTHALIVYLDDKQEDFSGYNIKTVTIAPSSNLGGLLTGTMDFSSEYAKKRIKLGYTDCKNIKANQLRIKSLLETNMDDEKMAKAVEINEMNDKQIMLETLKCLQEKEIF